MGQPETATSGSLVNSCSAQAPSAPSVRSLADHIIYLARKLALGSDTGRGYIHLQSRQSEIRVPRRSESTRFLSNFQGKRLCEELGQINLESDVAE